MRPAQHTCLAASRAGMLRGGVALDCESAAVRWLPANARWSEGTLRCTHRKEILLMKRLTPVIAILAFALVAGCAKKAEQASTTSSDSLLATNPVEQPQGNIAPSTA